jgi:putative flavoprotein involved in K+ transport
MTNSKLDVLIIGAGQAGLALGYHLAGTGLHFQLLESNGHIGDSWRKRYDSLTLFTPRAYSALPGLEMAGDQEGFAGRDEVAGYLEQYAQCFNLPVKTGVGVALLIRSYDSRYPYRAITTSGDCLEARAVVLATGAFQVPAIPKVAIGLSEEVAQFTTHNYKNPSDIPPGTVLVVGDGATGRDIANELAGSHKVILATGRRRKLIPARFLGKSSWWWLDKLGILTLPGESGLGQRIKEGDAFPNNGKTLKKLAKKGVQVLPRLKECHGNTVSFAGGETAQVDGVFWATGYRDNSDWVAIPEVKDEEGNFIHWHGLSPEAGFYHIGRPWQRSRGSSLIWGVGRDAAFLCEQILEYIRAEGVQPDIYSEAVALGG